MKIMVRSLTLLICLATLVSQAHAQFNPTLSIQGILKKSDGVAVDDGAYMLTFKLWDAASNGTLLWTEVQNNVEVRSGIYSTTLGIVTPLNIPFNQLYYLGVTIGSSPMELTPRNLLTSAPYALSLIGQSNKFPSSGVVKADSLSIKGGVLTNGGTPGLNGINKNGYAFSGNNGDNDSGMFSTADGKVALYSNNTEVLSVTPNNVQTSTNLGVNGNVSANNLNLPAGGSVSYNGLNDWRLVESDYFESSDENWQVYNKAGNQSMGWNNGNPAGASALVHWGGFAGDALLPGNNDYVLKKFFNLTNVGSFNYIKVKFRYYYIDTWDFGGGDRGWAAYAINASGSELRVGWDSMHAYLNGGNGDFNTAELRAAANFEGQADKVDNWDDGEMTLRANGTAFYVYFGAAVDENADNESFAIGAIEIYVR